MNGSRFGNKIFRSGVRTAFFIAITLEDYEGLIIQDLSALTSIFSESTARTL
jgi:hypothetical protein